MVRDRAILEERGGRCGRDGDGTGAGDGDGQNKVKEMSSLNYLGNHVCHVCV